MPVKKQIRRVRKAARRITPEGGLRSLVQDYLSARRIRWTRNQVGKLKIGARYVTFGEKGQADITAHVPHPTVERAFYILHIETKGTGEQEYDQKIWQAGVEASGEFYIVVKKLEQVIDWLEAHK